MPFPTLRPIVVALASASFLATALSGCDAAQQNGTSPTPPVPDYTTEGDVSTFTAVSGALVATSGERGSLIFDASAPQMDLDLRPRPNDSTLSAMLESDDHAVTFDLTSRAKALPNMEDRHALTASFDPARVSRATVVVREPGKRTFVEVGGVPDTGEIGTTSQQPISIHYIKEVGPNGQTRVVVVYDYDIGTVFIPGGSGEPYPVTHVGYEVELLGPIDLDHLRLADFNHLEIKPSNETATF